MIISGSALDDVIVGSGCNGQAVYSNSSRSCDL